MARLAGATWRQRDGARVTVASIRRHSERSEESAAGGFWV